MQDLQGTQISYCSFPFSTGTQIVLHLIELSSGRAHPSAKKHVLKVGFCRIPSTFNLNPTVDLTIYGSHLACLSGYDPGQGSILSVWDWRSGRLKGVVKVLHSDIVFLKEDLLLVPNRSKPSLDVYHIPLFTRNGSLEDNGTLLEPTLSLLLPELKDNASVISISCSANQPPNRFWPPDQIFSSRDYSSHHAPFYMDAQCSVLPFSLLLHDGKGKVSVVEILVRAEAVINYSRPLPSDTRHDGQYTSILPWNCWGPPSTRWFLCNHRRPSFGIRSVSGSRCIAAWQRNPAPDSSMFYKIEIFDFRQWKVGEHASARKRSSSCAENTGPLSSVETGTTTITLPDVFLNPVTSDMPYVRQELSMISESGQAIDISDISIYGSMIIINSVSLTESIMCSHIDHNNLR